MPGRILRHPKLLFTMQQLAVTCERIAATTKKLEKTAIVAEYLRGRELADAAISAVFLSGRAFPAFDERTLQIGGSALWKLVVELAARSSGESKGKQIPRGLKPARGDKNRKAPERGPEGPHYRRSDSFRQGGEASLTAAYRKRGD